MHIVLHSHEVKALRLRLVNTLAPLTASIPFHISISIALQISSHARDMALWIAIWLFSSSLWCRNTLSTDCHEIVYRHSWSPDDEA